MDIDQIEQIERDNAEWLATIESECERGDFFIASDVLEQLNG